MYILYRVGILHFFETIGWELHFGTEKKLNEVHGGSVLSLYVATDGRHSSDSKDRMFEGHCRSCSAVLVWRHRTRDQGWDSCTRVTLCIVVSMWLLALKSRCKGHDFLSLGVVSWPNEEMMSVGANPSTTLWRFTGMRGPNSEAWGLKGRRVKLKGPRGVEFLGRGCSPPHQLWDLGERCKLCQCSPGQSPGDLAVLNVL